MSEILAQVKSAFVAEDGPTRWTIGNDHVRMVLAWDQSEGWGIASLVNVHSGHIWNGHRAFALTWNGTRLDGQSVRGAKAHEEDDGTTVTLTVTLELTDELMVQVVNRVKPENAVIQSWTEVHAATAGVVKALQPLQYMVDHNGPAMLRWVRGVQDQGGWRPESGPYNSFKVADRLIDDITIESGPRSTWFEIP